MLLASWLVAPLAFAQGVTWTTVPAGEFTLGCSDETPTKKKTSPTRMPALEVTPRRISIGEYAGCVDAGVCAPVKPGSSCDTRSSAAPERASSLTQAQTFCAWAGGRVPTDTEWEFIADRGTDMNAGPDIAGYCNAMEWVSKSPMARKAYEGTRGGLPDLEPLRRCDRGDARIDGEFGHVSFRCVRTPGAKTTAPFPREVRVTKRMLLRFTQTMNGLTLEERLSEAVRQHTFVVCRDVVVPLGAFVREETRRIGNEVIGTRDATFFAYAAPCGEASFVITADDVREGQFRPLRMSDGISADKNAGCVLRRGGRTQKLAGLFGRCDVKFAGDLNDDGVSDFLVHREIEDPCVTATLLLSTGEGWSVFADDLHFCPD